MEQKTSGLNNQFRLNLIGVLTVLGATVITALFSWLLYEHTVNLLTENLRQRLLAIVTTAVVQLDANDINKLQTEDDWTKPEWSKVVNQLLKVENNNDDILFAYIFRKTKNDHSKMEFVADSHSLNPYANTDSDPTNDVDANNDGKIEADGPDYLQWPGQPYDNPPKDTFAAYNGAMTNSELYSDSFGEVITGYAPIKDEKGKTVAVLAIDIRAGDFFRITRQTLYPFLAFITFLIGVLLILAWGLIKIWNKRVELVEQLDRQKDELLGLVSHQLATPVSSIKWYLEMLRDGDLGDLTQEQKAHVSAMHGIGESMSDLVSMILDVSRIQLGRMRIEKQDLNLKDFFHELISTITPKAKEKMIQFNVNVPAEFPAAKLDRRYTNMTIENLLSNAVKYTPEGGTVNFTVKLQENRMTVTVADTGMGIPAEEQPKIFGRMFRASNARNAIDGNGFGLYVAKGAVEAQGGKIWFESTEGKGTIFYVELPLDNGGSTK